MDKATECDLHLRLEKARGLSKLISGLYDDMLRLKATIDTGHALGISIKTTTGATIGFDMNTSGLTGLEPTEVKEVLLLLYSLAATKLQVLKKQYNEL